MVNKYTSPKQVILDAIRFTFQYNGSSVHGHLTSKATSPMRSPLLSPTLFSSVQIIGYLVPVIRSPLH